MKVLEKGPGWMIKQVCTGLGNGGGGCGALLAVEKDDVYITSSTDISGVTDYYYTFRCPCCGVETDIKESEVPTSVRRLARERKSHIGSWRD